MCSNYSRNLKDEPSLSGINKQAAYVNANEIKVTNLNNNENLTQKRRGFRRNKKLTKEFTNCTPVVVLDIADENDDKEDEGSTKRKRMSKLKSFQALDENEIKKRMSDIIEKKIRSSSRDNSSKR